MTEHVDNFEFRKVLINELIDNEDFSREIAPYIKLEYFSEKTESQIWKVFQKYYEEYNKIPNRSILKVGIEKSKNLSDGEKLQAKDFIERYDASEQNDLTWLKDKTEDWCKLRASVNAVVQSMQILDGHSKEYSIEHMPSILADAVAVNFDRKIGTDYLESADERWELYHTKDICIPTGLDHFDDAMGGGYPVKSLIVFLASTGVGKSLTMCNSAAHALKNGNNVLYITMEMAEEKIAQRIDSNLFDTPFKEIYKMDKASYTTRFEEMKKEEYGRLIIKEYGTGSASITNFKALLQELDTKQNFRPQIIFVDYLNICASARAGKGANSYEKVKYIAEELRSMAMDYNVPVISATQANREGVNSSELDLTNTSESIALPATCDAMFALTATDEMRNAGFIKTIKLKNRFGDPNYNKVHMIGVDYSIMKLSDIEQPSHITAANEIEKQAVEKKTPALNTFKAGGQENEIEWS